MPDSPFQDAVHILHGDSAGGSTRAARARHVVSLVDSLGFGTCSVDPDEHSRLRREFWSEDGFDPAESSVGRAWDAESLFAALSVHPADRPVVLWTTPSWADSLSFWWLLDALARTGHDVSCFFVATLRRQDDFGWMHLGFFGADELPRAYPEAVPLSAAILRAGSALWRAFAGPDPRRFDRARRRGSRAFPELGRTAEIYGEFFPVADDDRLMLSDFDVALLGPLRPIAPTNAARVIAGPSGVRYLHSLPDRSIRDRLLAWTRFPVGDPAVVMDPPPRGNLSAAPLRITRRGRELVAGGLSRIDDAPPMFLGGIELFVGSNPWVCRTRGQVRVVERMFGRNG